jgi:molybdopterin-guanine dinucleotide biosynthesis protein A
MSCCAALLRAEPRILLGAVLAGGKSMRFGSDKAVAQVNGRALIDHVAHALDGQTAQLVVVGREHPGVRGIADQPGPDLGPLAGLAAALLEARTLGLSAVLTAPCDAYDLPADLAQRLHPFPAYVESQPVIGLWPASAAETALDILNGPSKHSMRAFAQAIGARAVQLPRNPANINTAADLEKVETHGL